MENNTHSADPIFDPHACVSALSAAFHNLETALGHIPTEDDRNVIYLAKVNLGTLMVGLLKFMIEDDRDEIVEERQ